MSKETKRMASSPDRGNYHIECEFKSVKSGVKTMDQAQQMIDFYKSWQIRRQELEETDEWKLNNMEYDMRTSEVMVNKAKRCRVYSQNLYAAICNNDFIKNDVWPLLQGKTWGASWRSAGGIVANMREEGDYIDWYCSGIRNDYEELDDDQYQSLSKEQQESYIQSKRFVAEGVIVDEIRKDLFDIGWLPVENNNGVL